MKEDRTIEIRLYDRLLGIFQYDLDICVGDKEMLDFIKNEMEYWKLSLELYNDLDVEVYDEILF